jgi:hypothetical protein
VIWRHARVAWRLARVRQALDRSGFQASAGRWLGPVVPGTPVEAMPWLRAIRRIGARWPGSKCLDQSLVLASLLRERGIDARLLIGAARGGAGIEAHAWVEIDGEPLGEPADLRERFRVLESWPRGG